MLGDEILGSCRVINHDARDESSLVDIGESGKGVPTRLCRHWLEANLRIPTGFVEPHFFAGFSGGPKMVAPVHHRLAGRVRAHVLLWVLAYYVEWHMRKRLAPILFDDHRKTDERTSPVQPAHPVGRNLPQL